MSHISGRTLALISAIVIAYALAASLVTNSYYQLQLTLIPLWACFALGWNILSGNSGLISFGHASFFGTGAYCVVLLAKFYNVTPWISIPLCIPLGGALGFVIGYPTFRLRGYYFALAMLAYPLALQNIFEWRGFQEVSMPIQRAEPALHMQFTDPRIYTLLALGMLVVVLLVALKVERSRFGHSLFAIKQNEPAAEAAGIDTLRWKLRAISLSGAIACMAGGFYAVVLLVVTPPSVFGVAVSAQALVLTMFGGVGTIWGPLIGAVTLIPLGEYFRAELSDKLPGIQGVIYGLAITLVVLLAPDGVFWRLRDRFFARRPAAGTAAAGPTAAASVGTVAARPPVGAVMMRVEGLTRSFGGLRAVDDVGFEVREHEILGIIGPNGAGKTTLFNLLNGFLPPDQGSVEYVGKNLLGLKPNQVCRLGVARTFQVVRPFLRMTVRQNVVVGAYVAADSDAEAEAMADEALRRVGLIHRAEALAQGLTNKELRLLELARALASRPKLLLMDETFAGLGHEEVEAVLETIRGLPSGGTTVVIIEHTMHAMVRLADRFVVLDHGRVIATGLPDEVTKNPDVIEAYLGKKWMALSAAG
jgi:ABC-type branched-subunit amino acid transport system ATPase component/ABC-type branched-subunit amino acid transport system permease subunit